MDKTFSLKKEDVKETWYHYDAEGKILGRLASEIAYVLRGKHSPQYTPHVNMQYHIIITNADKIKVTSNKMADKFYYSHSGYPGSVKEMNLEHMMKKNPKKVLQLAIKRMLPKSNLGNDLMRNLKIYAGPDHPHKAQQPLPFPLDEKGKKTAQKGE